MVPERMLVNKAVWIAYRAGKMILSADDFEVGSKGTKEDYVTSVDIAVQEYIRKELGEALPEAAFLGEEEGLDEPDIAPGQYYWIVDPIDGTANFARGFGESAVSIALAKDDEVVMGVVRNPYSRETFCAVRGKGAFLGGKPIRVSDRRKENSMVCCSWSAYDKSKADACFRISQDLYLTCEDLRRTGSAAYELCLLAKGAVDMHFEIRLAPWDYAAGSLMIEEAGGKTGSLGDKLDLKAQCLCMAANNEENYAYLGSVVRKHI